MRIVDHILELLYPSRCCFCRRFTEGELLCRWCGKDLPYTRGLAQSQKLTHIPQCVSPLYYQDAVRQSLLRYKFHSCTRYAAVYGGFITKCIDENEISCDIITWVPLSRKKLRRRGYDQAELLAREIAGRLGVPCAALLRKDRDTKTQSTIRDSEQRKANVSGAYRALDPARTQGKRVLLVDDIVTTGATLSECARTLKAAGAKQVQAATVARRHG